MNATPTATVSDAPAHEDGSPFAAIDPRARIGTTIAVPNSERVTATAISFDNQERGTRLAGLLYRPVDAPADVALPAVIVQGPMLSIKEQTASLYAQRIAALGYVTLTFDYSFFGESTGEPRQLEDPNAKASDVSAAVTYLSTLDGVQNTRIAAMGICGSGGYVPFAASKDSRISAVASVVPFTAVEALRNIPQLVDLEQAAKDLEAWETTGADPRYMILLPEGENEGAEYYFEADRGAHERWHNGAVTWSAQTWAGYDPDAAVAAFGDRPLLVVTAENAYTLDQARALAAAASGPTTLHTVQRARHFDMYDLEPYVGEVVDQIEAFLAANL